MAQTLFELQQNDSNYQRKVQINEINMDLSAEKIELNYTLFFFQNEKEIVKLRTTDVIVVGSEKVDSNGATLPIQDNKTAQEAQTAFEFWTSYISGQSFDFSVLLMQIVNFLETKGTFNI
jgi:hypothetical protein